MGGSEWHSNNAFARALFELCGWPNIKTLCCDSLDMLQKVINATPKLEPLLLSQIYVSEDFHNTIVPQANDSKPPFGPIRSHLPHLHTLCFDRCPFNNVEGFSRVASTCPIHDIGMIHGRIRHGFDEDQVYGLDEWVGPGPDLSFSYMPLCWEIEYTPLAWIMRLGLVCFLVVEFLTIVMENGYCRFYHELCLY